MRIYELTPVNAVGGAHIERPHAVLPANRGQHALPGQGLHGGSVQRGPDVVNEDSHPPAAAELADHAQEVPFSRAVPVPAIRVVAHERFVITQVRQRSPVDWLDSVFLKEREPAVRAGRHGDAEPGAAGQQQFGECHATTPAEDQGIGRIRFLHLERPYRMREPPVIPGDKVASGRPPARQGMHGIRGDRQQRAGLELDPHPENAVSGRLVIGVHSLRVPVRIALAERQDHADVALGVAARCRAARQHADDARVAEDNPVLAARPAYIDRLPGQGMLHVAFPAAIERLSENLVILDVAERVTLSAQRRTRRRCGAAGLWSSVQNPRVSRDHRNQLNSQAFGPERRERHYVMSVSSLEAHFIHRAFASRKAPPATMLEKPLAAWRPSRVYA